MMDWWAAVREFIPAAFLLLLMALSAWYGAWQRRGTIVCPTCGGAGRVRPPAACPDAGGGAGDHAGVSDQSKQGGDDQRWLNAAHTTTVLIVEPAVATTRSIRLTGVAEADGAGRE